MNRLRILRWDLSRLVYLWPEISLPSFASHGKSTLDPICRLSQWGVAFLSSRANHRMVLVGVSPIWTICPACLLRLINFLSKLSFCRNIWCLLIIHKRTTRILLTSKFLILSQFLKPRGKLVAFCWSIIWREKTFFSWKTQRQKLWKIYMHIFGGNAYGLSAKTWLCEKRLFNAEWRKCNRPFEAPAPAPSVLPGLFSGQPPQNWTPLVSTIFHLS